MPKVREFDPPLLVFVPIVFEWTIRSATEQDIEPVLALWDAAGSPPSVTDTREGLRRLLADGEEALLLAEIGRALGGSLIAAWDGWRGSFYRLAVHPDLRREGLATALLREGERRLRVRGAFEVDRDRGRWRPQCNGVLGGCGIHASTTASAIHPSY